MHHVCLSDAASRTKTKKNDKKKKTHCAPRIIIRSCELNLPRLEMHNNNNESRKQNIHSKTWRIWISNFMRYTKSIRASLRGSYIQTMDRFLRCGTVFCTWINGVLRRTSIQRIFCISTHNFVILCWNDVSGVGGGELRTRCILIRCFWVFSFNFIAWCGKHVGQYYQFPSDKQQI